MKEIDEIYLIFIEDFKLVLEFISEHFGETNVLLRKNQGFIPGRNLSIKNSRIKGYMFHGYGCEFVLKDHTVDIEFEDDRIGFTGWSFFLYSEKVNSQITEKESEEFLAKKVSEEVLKFSGKIFELI